MGASGNASSLAAFSRIFIWPNHNTRVCSPYDFQGNFRMNQCICRTGASKITGMGAQVARRYLISGMVQGVGYRAFAERAAHQIGVTGWARNQDDGRVEVHANGTTGQLNDFEARLRQGPRWAQVRAVEVSEAAVSHETGFHIR